MKILANVGDAWPTPTKRPEIIKPTVPCERRRHDDKEWICDRCGSLWTEMLNGTGWLPLACVERN